MTALRAFQMATMLVAACLAAVDQTSASPYSDAVLADGPLAYWRLGDAGPAVADSAGSNSGTGGANVLFGQPSLIPINDPLNTSVRFPAGGTGDASNRITIPGFNKFPGGSTGYTVEYWLNVPSGQVLPANTNVVGDGLSGPSFYMMNYLRSDRSIRTHYNGITGTSLTTPGGVVSFDQTHHVASVLDLTAGTAAIYVDGVLQASAAGLSGVPTNTSNPMYLGVDNREPGVNLWLDEVAFYNYPLSAAQILNHFNLAQSEPPPPPLAPEPGSLILFGAMLTAFAAGVWYRRRR